MKSIQDYINEALINKDVIKRMRHNASELKWHVSKDSVTINWPLNTDCKTWETLKFPKAGPYVVYYDKYHGRKHISLFSEALNMYVYSGTWEDMEPSMIIEAFPSLLDAVNFALKDVGYGKEEVQALMSASINRYDTLEGYYDKLGFIKQVLAGKIDELPFDSTAPLDPKKITKNVIKGWFSDIY